MIVGLNITKRQIILQIKLYHLKEDTLQKLDLPGPFSNSCLRLSYYLKGRGSVLEKMRFPYMFNRNGSEYFQMKKGPKCFYLQRQKIHECDQEILNIIKLPGPIRS